MMAAVSKGGNNLKVAHLLLLTGQSNAVGVTETGGAGLDPSWYDPQPDIKIWFDDEFQDMLIDTNTVDAILVGAADTKWGTEQSFTHALKNEVNDTVYVYKQALGGVGISYWQPGGLFYTRILNDIPLVLSDIRGRGYDQVNVYITWIQGEANVGSPTATYQSALENVLSTIRSIDKDMYTSPVVMVKLSPDYTYFSPGQIDTVNAAYDNIAAGNVNCYTIDRHSIGAVANVSDNIHDNDPTKVLIGNTVFELLVTNGYI